LSVKTESSGTDSRRERLCDVIDTWQAPLLRYATVVYELNLRESIRPDAVVGVVRIRWRRPDTGAVEEMARPVRVSEVTSDFSSMRARFRLAAAVAEFATLLRHVPPEAQAAALRDLSLLADRLAAELKDYAPAREFAETVGRLMRMGL